MKYLLIGLLFAFVGVAVAVIFCDIDMVVNITGGIGIVFILLSGLLSGAFVSGDQMRANLATESVESRNERHNMMTRSILLGIPSIIVALLFYFLI